MTSNILGPITIHKVESIVVELTGTIEWNGQATEFFIHCENMTDSNHNWNAAILGAESRITEIFQFLPLTELRHWCLSEISAEFPWFLTERMLDTYNGGTTITSQPEEMVGLLIPRIGLSYNTATNRTSASGVLTCPPIEPDFKITGDVNCWLGNHNFHFSLDNSQPSNFTVDG